MRPFTAADLQTTLAAVRDTAGEAQRAVDTIIAAGEAALKVLPDVFGHELQAALARLRRMFDDAMRDLAALIAQAGSPEALRASSKEAPAPITRPISARRSVCPMMRACTSRTFPWRPFSPAATPSSSG